jgi:glycosyltransferase involved in cell wall biosynthesis
MTADTVTGVWTYALDLCRGLSELGAEVELAAMGPTIDPDQRRDARAIPGTTLHFFRGRLEWMDSPWADVDASLAWLEGIAQSSGAHVLHANTLCHVLPNLGLPTLVVGHSCIPSWFEAVRAEAPPAQHDVYRQRVQSSLRSADVVVGPTGTMLAALQKHHGPFMRSTVVFNGRCFDGFAPGRKLPYVLAAGRLWDEAKNARAVATAAPRWPWPVYMAGPTRSPDEAEVGMSGVQLLGALAPAKLARWMAGASIFVAPARYEPFGLTMLEAAAAGCALVLGAIPSLREVWGDDACFVAPDDPDELAEVVAQLIEDESLRTTLAAAARVRALRLHHRRMAACYSALYHDLLASRLVSAASRAAGAHLQG